MTAASGVHGSASAPVELLVNPGQAQQLRGASGQWPSWSLPAHQQADLELLLRGAFTPLRGFLGPADCATVVHRGRLADGTRWPLLVTLDVPPAVAAEASRAGRLGLRDAEGVLLAGLTVEESWTPDFDAEAAAGLPPPPEPVTRLTGTLHGLQFPTHHDFPTLRRSPAAVRADLGGGAGALLAVPTTALPHRQLLEAAARAAGDLNAPVLVLLLSTPRDPADVDHFGLVRCWQAALAQWPADRPRAMLSLLPLSARTVPGGAALARALVAGAHGATHLLLDADARATPDLPLPTRIAAPPGLDDAQVRRLLAAGRPLPETFVSPAVAAELARRHPPRSRRGFAVFFTGLSGAGKSTIAGALLARLLERGDRPVTLLDGDLVRRHLSSELGFSRADRDLNIRRIGFVAAEITKNGGAAICAPIAPYDATRREVRAPVERYGGFVLVHVTTPLAVCEQRDRKGLYAKARAGRIPEFTGVSDPYEEPTDAEVVIDTTAVDPARAAEAVVEHLRRCGYLADDRADHLITPGPAPGPGRPIGGEPAVPRTHPAGG